MIDRDNYRNVIQYLDHQKRIKQCCIDTIKRKWAYLRHLLEYACATSFSDLERIDLTFPNYLESARNDNKKISLSPETMIDFRDRAAVALLYISAMRVSALTSIKLRSINLENMSVFQSPSDGVHTKNNKTMETILLPIYQLVKIAKEWFVVVNSELGENGYWYPTLSTDGLRFAQQEKIGEIESRNKSLRDGVRRLCNRARIYYRSPHKFRRGHGVYAVKHSKNLEEFQAYSQNMGHEDPGTTFKYYSKLARNDIRKIILSSRM